MQIFELLKNPAIRDHLLQALGGVLSLVLGVVARSKHKQLKAKKTENELLKSNIYQAKIHLIKELYDLQHFSIIERWIKEIFADTQADRFTVMFLMNGKVDFNYLTVLYDQDNKEETEIGGISPYSRIPIGPEYRKTMKVLEIDGFLFKKGPDFGLGTVNEWMELEEIKSGCWAFVDRLALDQYNDVIVYISVTSKTAVLNRHERNKLRLTLEGKIIPEIKKILRVPNISTHGALMQHFAEEKKTG